MKKLSENPPAMIIRVMNRDDLAFAAQCTADEGWVSENLTTLEGFFFKDPTGCLLAEENGRPIGICIATYYGTAGFIGELIIRPEARGRGVGAALLKHGVQILQEREVGTVYLDGVVKAVPLYERNGFRKVCRSWRFSGTIAGNNSPGVRRMTVNHLEQVIALDNQSFGADRGFFLRRRLELFPELSYVIMEDGRVTGFILGREGSDWLAAGPWVVEEAVQNPAELLNTFALEAHNRPISIGILETNQQACEMMRSCGFIAHPDSPWRMASGGCSDLGTSPNCYAVGSAAKG